MRHPAHDSVGGMSLANFLTSQRSSGFPGAPTCNVHGNALSVLEALPMGGVFSLLGQGYKLVATGHKFGGLVAHLFATRVLLQLHQEVAQARAMGINLSLNLADSKVSSYAFGAPFFATTAMTRTLAHMGVDVSQVNLHTLWKHGDGAPAFFAAASELYTVAAAARDANADAVAAAVEASGLPLDDVMSPASIARSSQITAVQDWCRHVAEGVDGLSRCRTTGPSRLMARPLDPPMLGRVCQPGGLFGPTSPLDAEANRLQQLRISMSEAEAVAAGLPTGPRAPANVRTSTTGAGPAARRRRSVEVPDGAAAPGASGLMSPGTSVGSFSRIGGSVSGSAGSFSGAAAAAAVGAVGASPAGRARRASLLMSGAGAANPKPVGQGHGHGHGHKEEKQTHWKDGLLHLLQVMGDGLGERYSPIGQFWVLGGSAKPADASGAGAVPSLTWLDGPKAMQTSAAWLAPGNGANLFARWEWGLDELGSDMMEAFPWATFRTTVTLRGAPTDRKELLRPSPVLDLLAMG
ncbi:hypothetical protein HYH02_002749 [Chlamydomonas schloesseri]|uniref:Uncharacterized protein n=1 Tax=Chlamydomonas schloesseri TaxID=2026947 RepID=A0A836BAX9_9CHLO|nr:hypothetical protein HYH02_002749 [Chlamydomonas schloesseri]|eukprot:KAG2452510.1 hypothetical protein HYH02_002749 [Chlamydomonas schloesseri]